MRNKHPHRVRIIRIDVEYVRLAKEIGYPNDVEECTRYFRDWS